MSRYSTK